MQCFDTFRGFYINFTLRQWTRRVERARIIFLTTTGKGGSRGQGIGQRGQLPPVAPRARPIMHPISGVSTFNTP